MSSLPCLHGFGVLSGLGLLRTLSPLLPHIRGFSSSYPSPLIPMSQFPAPVYALPESHLPPQLYQVPACTECRSPPLALSLPSLLFQSISKCLQSTGSLSEASRPAASASPGYLLEMQIIRVPFQTNSGAKFGVGGGQQCMFYQASR